jgi:hypothetical protein
MDTFTGDTLLYWAAVRRTAKRISTRENSRLRPSGAKACSHGWSEQAAATPLVAEPVEKILFATRPGRGEGIARETNAPAGAEFFRDISHGFSLNPAFNGGP